MENNLSVQWSQHAETLLKWSASVANQGTEFVSEQAPLLVQEYLHWIFWGSMIQAGINLAILIAMVFFARWAGKKIYEKDSDASMVCLILGILFCIPACFCAAQAIAGIMDAIKVLVAPRVIIVEKIAELVN